MRAWLSVLHGCGTVVVVLLTGEREEFRAGRFYGAQAAVAAVLFVLVVLVAVAVGRPWLGIVFLGPVIGGLWRARRAMVVLDGTGARISPGVVVPWECIDGVEVIDAQTWRWARSRPRSRLRLRLRSQPDGWVRIRGMSAVVEVPVVDAEDELTRSIGRWLHESGLNERRA